MPPCVTDESRKLRKAKKNNYARATQGKILYMAGISKESVRIYPPITSSTAYANKNASQAGTTKVDLEAKRAGSNR
jgi:hypothetical protein